MANTVHHGSSTIEADDDVKVSAAVLNGDEAMDEIDIATIERVYR